MVIIREKSLTKRGQYAILIKTKDRQEISVNGIGILCIKENIGDLKPLLTDVIAKLVSAEKKTVAICFTLASDIGEVIAGLKIRSAFIEAAVPYESYVDDSPYGREYEEAMQYADNIYLADETRQTDSEMKVIDYMLSRCDTIVAVADEITVMSREELIADLER